jgi:hypothetical protein
MSLDRKDIRAKLDADLHAALAVLCDVDGLDIGEFIERVVVREVRQRVHDASVIADRTARLGIAGSGRESAGTSGRNRE